MREHFRVPPNYFLSHSVGCLPKRAPDQLHQHYFEPWATSGGDAWPGWMNELDKFREGIGHLLGADARNICPKTNVSSGLAKAIHALPFDKQRPTILCSQDDFPTIGFVLKQAERAGYRVKFMTGDVTRIEDWRSAWDDSVGVVHITHAFSNTSKLAPVTELCVLAKTRGAISFVDIAQSSGAIPIDLSDWQPDLAIGTGVKFLCFGPGACFLFASDRMIETANPIDVGWFSHEAPFEMDIHDFRFAASAMKFFGGTPSPAPFILANAAIALWTELGLYQVHQAIEDHLTRLCAAVPETWLVSPRIAAARGATCMVAPENRDRFRDALAGAEVRCDERADGFRFSVHGYTDPADIDNLIAVINGAVLT